MVVIESLPFFLFCIIFPFQNLALPWVNSCIRACNDSIIQPGYFRTILSPDQSFKRHLMAQRFSWYVNKAIWKPDVSSFFCKEGRRFAFVLWYTIILSNNDLWHILLFVSLIICCLWLQEISITGPNLHTLTLDAFEGTIPIILYSCVIYSILMIDILFLC